MLEFLMEMLVEGIFSTLLGALGWLVKMVFYPLLLGIGWLCLWWPQRAHSGAGLVWQRHHLIVLHQAGWEAAVVATQYFTAVMLVLPLLLLVAWAFYSLVLQ